MARSVIDNPFYRKGAVDPDRLERSRLYAAGQSKVTESCKTRKHQTILENSEIQNGDYLVMKVASVMLDNTEKYDVAICDAKKVNFIRLECIDKDASEVLYRTLINATV